MRKFLIACAIKILMYYLRRRMRGGEDLCSLHLNSDGNLYYSEGMRDHSEMTITAFSKMLVR